jgi:hypothetical protein
MTKSKNLSEARPPLYETRSVPFEKLSADDFEKCVFECFLAIQSHQELRIDGQPAGSGDGGFDVYGIAVNSNRKLCIQCKRQKASLGLPLLAKEVAKVAMTTHLEKSDVGVHFFICSGGVTQTLRRLLRETDWITIINEAQQVIRQATEGELHALKARLAKAGENAEEVVCSYLQALDRLVAWDMREFDAALSPVWDSAIRVLERHFKVSTTVREHPRALFSRQAYQEKCRSFTALVQPQLEESGLPAGIVEFSGANPRPQPRPAKKKLLTVNSLAALEPGEVALVVAEGGAGKTTLLELIRAEVAKESHNSTLSVLITCAEYVSGALDEAIHAQLGVQSGSWRTLPDKVQILCDGINEAQPGAVRALFAELKPLLTSKSVSCIFTSRHDSRAVRTVLPVVPCASLCLVPLTPGKIRALARHELTEESEVDAFADTYRAMATRAGGSFMWTPFAVGIALERWRGSRQLGNTLGDLLDAALFARANRDLEILSPDQSPELPKTSVLAIASAMAFEMLIVDSSVASSAGTIGDPIKRAMSRCSDVFGIDGLSSSQLVGLLRKHDFVQQTPDESFQWNHQLVAGALASKHLAPQWKQHLGTLQQPLADDAWVFATGRIPESELDEYLGQLFQADLMLGATASEELAPAKRDRCLQHIFKAVEQGQHEELQAAGFFALARLGTEKAISFLKEKAKDRRSEVGFLAARALAYSGNRLFLLGLLNEVDHSRRMGWMMSGGNISIWEAASLPDRLAIARERLTSVTPGEPVNESLSLASLEASQEDIQLFEAHLHAANDLTAWGTALRAISNADRDHAQSLFEEQLSHTTSGVGKAEIMWVGHKLELSLDVDTVFALLMDLLSEEESNENAVTAKMKLTTDVLGELPLSADIRRQIEDQLLTGKGKKMSTLWQLAAHVDSPVVARIALDSFKKDPSNAGMAANFFIAQHSLREEHYDALQAAISLYLKDKGCWFTFNSWRVLDLEAELGFTVETSKLLQLMALRLTELRELTEFGEMPEFDESEAHIAQEFTIEHAKYHLQHYAGFLVPGVIGAKGVLSSSILLKFLHFDLASQTPGKEIVNAYREIDPALLDDELESVKDEWAQRAALGMLCEFGLTDRRLELLRTHLRRAYCHPAGLSSVKKALEKCWNANTFKMVVETISDFEDWPREWQQLFWDLVNFVSERISHEDRSFIEHHAAIAKTAFARRVLHIWHQETLDSRVGLSRQKS